MSQDEVEAVTSEEWRPIAGSSGWYEVSSFGQVRSWKARSQRGWLNRAEAPRLLKAPKNGNGYPQVKVITGGMARTVGVHVLVAEAFIGPRPSGDMHVCHGDGNPVNNHASNLRYDTRQENVADMIRHGTIALGEVNGKSKLTEPQVREIKTLLREGGTRRGIAGKFGVTHSAINSIASGESWGWLDAV